MKTNNDLRNLKSEKDTMQGKKEPSDRDSKNGNFNSSVFKDLLYGFKKNNTNFMPNFKIKSNIFNRRNRKFKKLKLNRKKQKELIANEYATKVENIIEKIGTMVGPQIDSFIKEITKSSIIELAKKYACLKNAICKLANILNVDENMYKEKTKLINNIGKCGGSLMLPIQRLINRKKQLEQLSMPLTNINQGLIDWFDILGTKLNEFSETLKTYIKSFEKKFKNEVSAINLLDLNTYILKLEEVISKSNILIKLRKDIGLVMNINSNEDIKITANASSLTAKLRKHKEYLSSIEIINKLIKKYSNTTLPNLFSEVCQDEATLNNLTIKIKDNRTNFVTKNKFDDKISEISILHSKILKLKNSIRSPKTTKRTKNNPREK